MLQGEPLTVDRLFDPSQQLWGGRHHNGIPSSGKRASPHIASRNQPNAHLELAELSHQSNS